MDSLPFDFDPLSLDFPALTLQCLQAPPTLFSSTPHPTSTSWSIQPPAQKQYEALKLYFHEEFRKWRVTCAMATTASHEELTYPPSYTHFPRDLREGVKKAEEAAAALEVQVNEHLQSTYHVWEQLPAQRKTELWGLELARSVGRRQKDVEKLKETQHAVRQENANLKTQIDQLNRLQQPREFRIVPPATIPIDKSLLSYMFDRGAKGSQSIGLNVQDRHADLDTIVSRAIDRWKTVIVSSRGPGMAGQRPLDQATPTPTSATPASVPAPVPPSQMPNRQQRSIPMPTNTQANDLQSTTTTPAAAAAAAATTTMAAASSTITANDENSDQDADAEMEDDDNFAPITPIVAKPSAQPHQQLEVPRTRGHGQRLPTTEARFAINGSGSNRGQAMPGRVNSQHGHAIMNNGDYGTLVQGVSSSEPMYMD